MKQFKLLILLIFISLMLTACGATIMQVVDDRGVQRPVGEFNAQSVSTEIEISCHGTAIIGDSEDSVHPEYFNLSSKQKIYSTKTKEIFIELYVRNPKGVNYRLVKKILIDNHVVKKEIYKGNIYQKSFQLHGPLKYEDKNINLWFELYIEGSQLCFFRKDMTYIVNPFENY